MRSTRASRRCCPCPQRLWGPHPAEGRSDELPPLFVRLVSMPTSSGGGAIGDCSFDSARGLSAAFANTMTSRTRIRTISTARPTQPKAANEPITPQSKGRLEATGRRTRISCAICATSLTHPSTSSMTRCFFVTLSLQMTCELTGVDDTSPRCAAASGIGAFASRRGWIRD